MMIFYNGDQVFVQYSNMSRCESQLRHFLKSLTSEQIFPRQSILNFLAINTLNTTEFLKIHNETWQYYLTNVQHFRETIMLIYIGLTKNLSEMIENAIDFIEGMILSRLIMLIFSQKLEFQADRVLIYLEPTIQLAVVKALESGKEKTMLNMLQRVNAKHHKFNEIGFLLETVFIKKIQKYLQDSSLYEFNQLLKGLLHSKKITRLFNNENNLHFRHIALLRQEQEGQQTYFLQFMNGGKLMKLKQSLSMNALPNWVKQAFWKTPKSLNFEIFYTYSAASVYSFLSEIQVFASSPLIKEFDSYIQDDKFYELFEQFLLGLDMSSQPYQFHWQKMRKTLQLIRKNSQTQNPCYQLIMAEQMFNSLSNQRLDNEGNRHK